MELPDVFKYIAVFLLYLLFFIKQKWLSGPLKDTTKQKASRTIIRFGLWHYSGTVHSFFLNEENSSTVTQSYFNLFHM